ncbi:MAG: BrnT family toxin [Euryarchaeota archaeon]|nr:BrnT family toxin [Euryarchaeota archaeon]
MRIEGIIWFDEIVEKLEWKHGVQPREVVEIFINKLNKPEFRFVEKGHRSGEHVYAAMGQTDAGRHLIIFFYI